MPHLVPAQPSRGCPATAVVLDGLQARPVRASSRVLLMALMRRKVHRKHLRRRLSPGHGGSDSVLGGPQIGNEPTVFEPAAAPSLRCFNGARSNVPEVWPPVHAVVSSASAVSAQDRATAWLCVRRSSPLARSARFDRRRARSSGGPPQRRRGNRPSPRATRQTLRAGIR